MVFRYIEDALQEVPLNLCGHHQRHSIRHHSKLFRGKGAHGEGAVDGKVSGRNG